MNKLRHVDFQTVLIAPLSFIKRSSDPVKHFDIAISYEDIVSYVRTFARACTT